MIRTDALSNLSLWARGSTRPRPASGDPVDSVTASEKPLELYKPDGQSSLRHDCVIQSFCWTPQGKVVSAAWPKFVNESAPVRVWNPDAGEPVTLEVSKVNVRPGPVACSPDGREVAVGWEDGTFSLYSSDGPELTTLMHAPLSVPDENGILRDRDDVTGMAYSPDGKTLATAGMDGRILLWDTATRQERACLQNPDWTTQLCYTPDGSKLVSRYSGGVAVWDLASGTRIHDFPDTSKIGGGGLALSEDGKKAAAVLADCIKVWDLESGAELGSRKIRGAHKLAFAGEHVLIGEAIENAVHDWNLGTGQVKRQELPYRAEGIAATGIKDIRVSPDGKRMAIGLMDYNLTLWTRDAQDTDLGHMADALRKPDNPEVRELGGFVYVGSVRVPKRKKPG